MTAIDKPDKQHNHWAWKQEGLAEQEGRKDACAKCFGWILPWWMLAFLNVVFQRLCDVMMAGERESKSVRCDGVRNGRVQVWKDRDTRLAI
jgi:hypothetical protein